MTSAMEQHGRVASDVPVLEVSDLSVSFASGGEPVRVIDSVSFDVYPGETVGLVGESGSGKSVTCMSATGLIRHVGGRIDAGRIMIDGEDVTRIPSSRWRQIRPKIAATIFQQPIRSLNPAFTVGDQIAESLRVHDKLSRKEAWAEAVRLLDSVKISHAALRARDYPHMMSGGMCQRVMIAMALACRPQLLVADEPTTALDVTVQKGILELLNDLQAELGFGVLYVSHDLEVVREVCDRVIVMYAGQIVEYGEQSDLFEFPKHPYTAGLIASTPSMDSQRHELGFIPGTVPSASDFPSGCRFHPRCTFARESMCTEGTIDLTSFNSSERDVRCVRAGELKLHGGPIS